MATYYVNSAVGNDGNAGTSPGSGNAWASISYAFTQVAPGDTVYIEALAGNAASYPTSGLDYTLSTYLDYLNNPSHNGSSTSGYVRWIGRNGIPTIGSAHGLGFYFCKYQWFEGLYLVATGAINTGFGIIYGTGGPNVVKDCAFNTNGQAAIFGIRIDGGEVRGCEFYGGSTSPSALGSYGIQAGTNSTYVIGCNVHHCNGDGIYEPGSYGAQVVGNRVWRCAGNGITTDTVGDANRSRIAGNTVDANLGHGVAITATAGLACVDILNNCVTNHVGSGKYGLAVADGSTGTNDARKAGCDHNDLYNNATNYQNVSAGAGDLSVDPGYSSASTGDFTPTNIALQAGYPSGWIGAVQPASSGGTTTISITSFNVMPRFNRVSMVPSS